MSKQDWVQSVAPCGLVCGLCQNAAPERGGCPGCRSGGGAKGCYQWMCCTRNGLDGCWQCDDFPCDNGFFTDEAWQGVCIGSVQCIRESGVERFVELLISRLGDVVEYGDYRFREPHEIRAAFAGRPVG